MPTVPRWFADINLRTSVGFRADEIVWTIRAHTKVPFGALVPASGSDFGVRVMARP